MDVDRDVAMRFPGVDKLLDSVQRLVKREVIDRAVQQADSEGCGGHGGLERVQCAPRMRTTTAAVRTRIVMSLHSDHSRMYRVSSATTWSNSVTWFLPPTCHGPVIPGFTSNRA